MRSNPTRWLMTRAGKPFVPTEFEIDALTPGGVCDELTKSIQPRVRASA